MMPSANTLSRSSAPPENRFSTVNRSVPDPASSVPMRMRRAMVLLATPASMVTSRWRMTRSDDRTLRPRTTAVSRDLTVLRPYVLHVLVLRLLEPRVPEPHVLGHSAELPPVEQGVDGPAARHFTARTGHGSLSCEHHHGAGEALSLIHISEP